jgi:hypothetical protein
VTPPALVIVVPLEGNPEVRLACFTDAEEARLRDWLGASGYAELIDLALELAHEREAA